MHNNYRELKRLSLAIDCHTYITKGLLEDPQDFIDKRQNKIANTGYVTVQEREDQERLRIEETIKAFVNKKA